MSLFAIADTHFSFGTDKPMDKFYGWNDYVSRLEKNWNRLINDDDTVVIAGDISWAMDFDQLVADFEYINNTLKGNKIIIKGNHDYWWNTRSKMENFLKENNFDKIKIIHNNAEVISDFAVCGSRGWLFDSQGEHDIKVLNREVQRIKSSIDYAKNSDKIPIVFLHYPPVTQDNVCVEIMNLLKNEKISRCYYGHLHGQATQYSVNNTIDEVKFSLISADYLDFCPILIEKF